jgi:hypothetical protein
VLAGFLAFLGSAVLGLAVTVLVVRSIAPEVPKPTEAYQGFGDYVLTLFWFHIGAGLSFVAAVGIGLAIAARVRMRPPPSR